MTTFEESDIVMNRDYEKVLDHGFVRLVEWMGDDMSIVRAARVSFNAPPRKDGSDEKLIGYLMKNRHTSPFEAVVVTFEVKAPIFVLRQWHRHRTWSYNEVSARYCELPEDFYIPELENIGKQDLKNKQARTLEQHPDANIFADTLTENSMDCFRLYQTALADGIPRELARLFLPMNTYSRMFATVDLHNLFHFLRLRLDKHAQWEIQQYAKAMLGLTEKVCPIACKTFRESLQ